MNRRGFLGAVASAILASRIAPAPLRRQALQFQTEDRVVMYVQAKSTLHRGDLLYWDDREKYIVDRLTDRSHPKDLAGVAIGKLNKDFYGFIQISGRSRVTNG